MRTGWIDARWTYDGPLRRALLGLKFSARLALAGPLGRLLAEDPRLRSDASERPWDLATAAPLHWRRRWRRGFDQSEELLRWALRHARGGPAFAPRLLVRQRATPPQTRQDSALERAHNLRGSFRVRDAQAVAGRRVLVVDDVTTTGATLSACMAALVDAGAEAAGGLALLRAE
ncbi:ComF-related protein [Plesiocystis pacifica SIR-1]|uniref:ComF-related protein n=1 Tax=Plesiocystis pacifica SIR-1 TaxID=391625 RepID=A6G4B4_9BACT|nr:phosphoribosyltransferase family protein [Plesiocystis pacifica]EDM79226.1 ComF-related protein [Plesiocystis pacifica SIR-1]